MAPVAWTMGATAQLTSTRDTIFVGSGDYVETVVFDGVSVTLIGEDGASIKPSLGAGEVAVLITGVSDVTFDNVDVALDVGGSDSSVALKCDTATNTASVSYSNGTISGSAGIGVSASRCDLTVTGSTISRNLGGGIDIVNSDFTLVNNFVANNGGNETTHAGVHLEGNGTTKVFELNTVVGNQVGNGTATTGVTCNTLAPVEANNNIVYSGVMGGGAVSGSCTWTYSNVEGGATGVDGNIDEDPLLVNNSAISGDYHLQSGSLCIDAADPNATLTTDIDGEARPQGAASLRDMGADEAG